MSQAVCRNCGSRSFRADRSLGGRLICQSCGTPAGSRPVRAPSVRTGRRRPKLWLTLLVITIVVLVVLSAL
ncbi:TFIIB-type zinc finger domain-containing protein [Synechococcus sp. CC9616]|uniref:TFIIB-type zinc finger domain-containing protein n=1 Tax=Synechococcus sp. CC9616 TaxID=110663 RepID=UPI0009071061|nr:TFIIB-type zinc finger domain-containing protein [Synechococcus sp. CC9616]RPF79536.1 MAG: transcriptional regulator [Synechococcus sp. TMED20]